MVIIKLNIIRDNRFYFFSYDTTTTTDVYMYTADKSITTAYADRDVSSRRRIFIIRSVKKDRKKKMANRTILAKRNVTETCSCIYDRRRYYATAYSLIGYIRVAGPGVLHTARRPTES